jgi:Na+-translocating ferredoxin:NAD+ oxidoreductase RnfC subunit
VKEAKTIKVPLGTSFRACIEMAGGLTCDNPAILTGGVMMGGYSSDLDASITKTIGGLIVLPADHYLVQRKTASKETYTRVGHGQCDQCSMCTELCPRYLMGYPIEPHKVMRNLLMSGEAKQRLSLWAQFCCECNICSLIACPEQLDPKSICVDAKALLRETKTSRTEQELNDLVRGIHPARSGREIPISQLYTRLGLNPYDRPAKYSAEKVSPATVTIPLRQHIGASATATVSVGQSVRAGDVVGTVDAKDLGCPVHSGIAGVVSKVTKTEVVISA